MAVVIGSLTIKDTVRFEDYRRMLLPTEAKYGGRLVARGGPIVLKRKGRPKESSLRSVQARSGRKIGGFRWSTSAVWAEFEQDRADEHGC